MRKLFSLLFLIVAGFMMSAVNAADFTETINNAATATKGQSVIYEMNVGSFTAAGTFNAAKDRLGELKKTGIDIVWLMPIYPRGASKSPYAVLDFETTNASYGTVDQLKSFVTAAHNLNMKVILDWVPNHTANEHAWKTAHPAWYNGVHSYSDVSDLNYDNEELKAEMMRIMKSWIDRCDIDGFRFDFVTNTKPSYWLSANQTLKDYAASKGKSDFILLAEIDTNDNPRFSNKTNNIGFTADYAWWLQETVLKNGYGANGNVATLTNNLKKFVNDSPSLGLSRMVYLTNHDQNWNDGGATLTSMYGDSRYALTTLAFTIYGMPLIFNSQEIGGNQKLDYFNDTKISWTSVDTKMQNTIKTLCALKHSEKALADNAAVTWKTTNNSNVIAYTRSQDNSEVLVLINLGTTQTTVQVSGLTAGEWSQWLDSKTITQSTGKQTATLSATQSFSIDAKGYQVYVLESSSVDPDGDAYVPTLDNDTEISIFFETPTDHDYFVWVWGDLGGGEAYCVNTSYPGDAMTLKGKTAAGNNVYKYTLTKVSQAPGWLIIARGGTDADKVYDGVPFVNHGYYVEGNGTPVKVISEVSAISGVADDGILSNADNGIYNLNGIRVATLDGESPSNIIATLPKGIYIFKGKKFINR